MLLKIKVKKSQKSIDLDESIWYISNASQKVYAWMIFENWAKMSIQLS